MSQRSQRKRDHLLLAEKLYQKRANSLDRVFLLRPALPETKYDLAAIQTTFLGKKVAAPFFIEAMTGGSKQSLAINRQLGKIADKQQIALALGSASILEKEPAQLKSYSVARQEDPGGVLLANINAATSSKMAKKIVNWLHADALQIHVNVMQEIVMPEGDHNFHWLNNLINIRQEVTVPIIIKEVGFGLDQGSIKKLHHEGFEYFDLGGSGGTNFVEIENQRTALDYSYLQRTGLPLVIAAVMARQESVNFIASGGIRNPLDVLKSLVLGADFVGVANVFLHSLQKEDLDLNQQISLWKKQLALLLAAYGANNLSECSQIKYSFDIELNNQIKQLVNK